MANNELNVASIASLLSGSGLDSISQAVGADQEGVASVLSSAIPTLLENMKNNAATEDGAASLSQALQDHSGADLSDVVSFLGSADDEDGAKILGHIFGSGQQDATAAMSQSSGLSSGQVSSILFKLAPLLLTLLGQQQNSTQSANSSAGVTGLLGAVLGGGSNNNSGNAGGLDLTSIALNALMGGGGNAAPSEPQEESSKPGGLLSGLLNLLH